LDILTKYDEQHINEPGRNIPIDIFLRYYFLQHKADFDSDARNQMVELVYTLQRYKGYLNAISERKSTKRADVITWDSRMKAFERPDFADLFDHPSIPEHARCSVPLSLFELIAKSHSQEQAFKICRTALESPKLTIRANTLKTT